MDALIVEGKFTVTATDTLLGEYFILWISFVSNLQLE